MTTSPDDRTSDHVPTPDTTAPADPAAAASAPVPDGERFGPFVLLGPAGRDGPFELSHAWQVGLSRRVVVKRPAAGAPPAAADWLRAEAAAAVRVAHPGVVPVVEAGEAGGVPYLATAAADGETLVVRLARGPVPARIAAGWAAQLAETLFEVHRGGAVHGNIRPEYVHLGTDGRVRLSGFGTAVRPPDDDGYAAPERAAGSDPVPRSDVFAVGALLEAMLTGGPPDGGGRMPRDLRTIAERCRVRSFGGYGTRQPTVPLLTDLRRYLAGKPLRYDDGWSVRAAWRWCRRNTRTLAWVVVVAAALAGGRAWDRARNDAAWDVLTRTDATPEEYARAAGHFDRLIEYSPHDVEAGTAESLTLFRLGKRIDDRRSRHVTDGSVWGEIDSLTAALYVLRDGRREEARHLVEGQRTVARSLGVDPWPSTEWGRRLVAEFDALSREPRVVSVTGDRPDDVAFRQWILADTADAVWERSPAARRAIPVLVRLLADYATRTDEAASAERRRYEGRLRRIDPDWASSAEARTTIPELTVNLAYRQFRDNDQARSIAATLGRIAPGWPRGPEARAAIPGLIETWLGSSERGADAQLGPLMMLARIDPEWRRSPECRDVMRNVARKFAAYTPALADWSNPTKEPDVRGGFEPPGERPYTRSYHGEVARRTAGALAVVGPLPGGLPELTTQLSHPDPVYDAVLAIAAAALDPEWFATDAGKAEVERLVVRCGDDDRPTREWARGALTHLSIGTDDVVRAIAGGLSAAKRFTPPNKRHVADDAALTAFEPTWPECDMAALVTRVVAGLSDPDASKRAAALRVLQALGPVAAPAVPRVAPLLADPSRVRERGGLIPMYMPASETLGALDSYWERTPAARRAVPAMLSAISVDIPPYDDGVESQRHRTLRALVDWIDPAWRSAPDAGRHLPALAEALRFPPPELTRDQWLFRLFQARETLVWYAWVRVGGSNAGRSPLAEDVVRTLAARLDEPPAGSEYDRVKRFKSLLLYEIASIGPPADVIPALVRTHARGDYEPYWRDGAGPPGQLARYLDEIAPGWPDSPAARGARSLWEQRLADPSRDGHEGRIAADLSALGPAAAPLVPAMRGLSVNPKHGWQGIPLLPLLDRLDPDWVWHPDVDVGLAALKHAQRTQKLERGYTDYVTKAITHIVDRRAMRPRPKAP